MDQEGWGSAAWIWGACHLCRAPLEERPQETGCAPPAITALPQPASKQAGGRGALGGGMMTGMACCSAYGL